MQSNHTVRQHIFFDHVGQIVSGGLAVFGQSIKPLGQLLHDPCCAGHHNEDQQGELPIEKKQISHKGNQCKAVSGQAQQSRNQLIGASLNLIDQGIGQGAG